MLEGEIPDVFKYSTVGKSREFAVYEMWSHKLASETWDLLNYAGIVGKMLDHNDYPTSQAAGLTLMAMLADVMAGDTRARVTDRGLAYATLANVVPQRALGSRHTDDNQAIVPKTLRIMNLDRIPLARLVELREREDAALRQMRHAYLDALEGHLKVIAPYADNSADRDELERVFLEKMEDDLRGLKEELGMSRREALLSKEILVLVGVALTAAAALHAGLAVEVPEALGLAGLPATVGGVFSVKHKYGKNRYDILRKHPMAYPLMLDPRRRW